MRTSRKRRTAAAVAVLSTTFGAAVGIGLAGTGQTYAKFSDFAVVEAQAGAGVWDSPRIPSRCGDPSSYQGRILWGTDGDDVLEGGNRAQIIMGLGGNDTIQGGNSGDCLVGGAGDDTLLGGNAKDIAVGGPGHDTIRGGNGKDDLVGGPGDDDLEGGNGKDDLDGGADTDVCDGGSGNDTIVNCEDAVRAASTLPGPFAHITVQPDPAEPGSTAEQGTREPAAAPPAADSSPSADSRVTAGDHGEAGAPEDPPEPEPEVVQASTTPPTPVVDTGTGDSGAPAE